MGSKSLPGNLAVLLNSLNYNSTRHHKVNTKIIKINCCMFPKDIKITKANLRVHNNQLKQLW
jgi:hypothetical protein